MNKKDRREEIRKQLIIRNKIEGMSHVEPTEEEINFYMDLFENVDFKHPETIETEKTIEYFDKINKNITKLNENMTELSKIIKEINQSKNPSDKVKKLDSLLTALNRTLNFSDSLFELKEKLGL